MGDQLEVFGCGDDVGMRGCPGESGGRRFMTGCGGVSLFGEFDGAAGAAHRIATAPRRAVRVRPHLAASGAVIETLRTRGVRNMIAVLPVVSRAYELCIPLPHTESQTFDVADTQNVRCTFPAAISLPFGGQAVESFTRFVRSPAAGGERPPTADSRRPISGI